MYGLCGSFDPSLVDLGKKNILSLFISKKAYILINPIVNLVVKIIYFSLHSTVRAEKCNPDFLLGSIRVIIELYLGVSNRDIY